jgi:hypothetical protein
MDKTRVRETLAGMKDIVKELRRAGETNSRVARDLSEMEAAMEMKLGYRDITNFQVMSHQEGPGAYKAGAFAGTTDVSRTLDKLEEMIGQLESQLR